ncbi:mucin-19-like isoform X1 [Schistocerca gregaria]|uniref:mucin-19-like isoform X1 n=1 Tax=Schistocerca gregaria TaxID=7010 RepID=UPI00211E7275|nr:mucin-19-like isoform X1 [Schistocerca gregaria]
MLVRVMVLFQLVLLVIAGGVLSDDGRRYRGVVPLQLPRDPSDGFQHAAADSDAARRLQRRSTAAPSSLASRRRATAQARAALRRRLAGGADAEMLFTSETRNAHAGRLPPPEEDTTKPPGKEENDSGSENKEVSTSPRYVLRGRRPPYTVLDRRASSANSSRDSSEEDEAAKQRKRRPSKETSHSDDDDDDDSDSGGDDSSEERRGAKRDGPGGGRVSDERKLVRKRRPGQATSGAESKDTESVRGVRSSTATPTQEPTTEVTPQKSTEAASSTAPSADGAAQGEQREAGSRKRRPYKVADSAEETTKAAEAAHMRRRPSEPALSPPSSPPFHPMLPAASALTMSDSLYNHFRPLSDVPEDHLLPFLSFGKKLPSKAAAVAHRAATGSTNSLLPEPAAGHGRGGGGGGWALTTAPPPEQQGSGQRRPPEDVVDEHMDVALVRTAVERNKAARGAAAPSALRTLYTSAQRRPGLDESTTTTSSGPAQAQNGSVEVPSTPPLVANVDANRTSEAPASPSIQTDVPPPATSSPKTQTPAVVTYRRRSTTTTVPPSVKPLSSSDSSSNLTNTSFPATTIASPFTKSTTSDTANSFIATNSSTTGSTTGNMATTIPTTTATSTTISTSTATSSTTSTNTTPSTITTTPNPSRSNDRPSSRWTIIVTTPPAPQETFPPPPRFTRKPAAVSYTANSPKHATEGTTAELNTTPVYESNSVSPVLSLQTSSSPASESSEIPSALVSSLPLSTSSFRVRFTSPPSVSPARDPLPHKPRNSSIYSTINRRPFLRKPPAKLVTATSPPNQRNLTEPPQFTNSVYMDARHSLLPKPSNISWLPVSQELPVKNYTKISLQRPAHKYPRPDITLRRRPTLRDNEHISVLENTTPVTDLAKVRVNETGSSSLGAKLGSAAKESPVDIPYEGMMLGLSPPPPTTKILSTAVVTSVSVQGEWRSPVTTTIPPALLPLPLELTAESESSSESRSSSAPAPSKAATLNSSVVNSTARGNTDVTTVVSVKNEPPATAAPVPQTTVSTQSSEVSSSIQPSSTSGFLESKDIPNHEQQKQNVNRVASSISSQIESTTQRPEYKLKIADDPTTTPEVSSEPVTLPDRNLKNVTAAPSSRTQDTTTVASKQSSEVGALTTPSTPVQELEKATQPTEESAVTTTVGVESTFAGHISGMAIFERPDKEYDLPIVHLYNGSSTVWMTEAAVPARGDERTTQKTVATESISSPTPKAATAEDTGSPTPKTNATAGGQSTSSNSSYQPGVQWGAGVQPGCGNASHCYEAAAPTPDSEDPEDSWGVHAGMYALGVLCTVPLAIAAAFGVRFLARKRRKFLDESDTCSEVSCPPRGLISRADTDIDADSKATRLQTQLGWEQETLPVTCWEVPRSKLRLQTVLGQGNFGQVLKAEIDDICGGIGSTRLVAVKTVKEDASQRDKDDLLREMEIMKTLGAHPNVVTLLGCCTEQEPHLLIMEYVMYGKLLAYLRDHRTRRKYFNFCEDDSDALTSRDLTIFAYCVARGMEYLASRGIIHRDLAARNVLVDHNKMCKVADFGMSRSVQDLGDVYEQRHTKGALPIRWMAPESLLYRIFTHKSDVWSFGILIWEIVTLGSTPYPGQSAREVVRSVREGGRLERPPHCRPEFFRLASRCWHHDPSRRPSFGELKRELAALVEDVRFGGGYVDLDAFADHGYCYGRIPTAVRPSANNTADTTTTAEECDAEVISM